MRHIKTISSVLVTLGLVGFAIWETQGPTSRPANAADDRTPERNRARTVRGVGHGPSDAQLARWRRTTSSTTASSSEDEPAVVGARLATAAPDEPPLDSDARAEQIDALEQQIARDHHARLHGEEARDLTWAPEHEANVREFLGAESFAGNVVESVDCRSSQCRLTIQHETPDATRRLLEAWGHGPFRHGGFFQRDDQTQSTTLYIAREGHPLVPADFSSLHDEDGGA